MHLSSSFSFCRTSQSNDPMLDRSVLPWQEEMDIAASLLGPVPHSPSFFATGHMLLKNFPNVPCLTHLAGAGFTFWGTLRNLLLGLLWMETQESEATQFTSPCNMDSQWKTGWKFWPMATPFLPMGSCSVWVFQARTGWWLLTALFRLYVLSSFVNIE